MLLRPGRLEDMSPSLPQQLPPATEAQHPRKQWAQKRNFKNAKPGLSLLGANLLPQPLNQNLEGREGTVPVVSSLRDGRFSKGDEGVNKMKTVYYKANLNI